MSEKNLQSPKEVIDTDFLSTQMTRRDFLKRSGVAVIGGTALSIGATHENAIAVNLDSNENPNATTDSFSNEVREYINSPFNDQVATVRNNIEALMTSRSKPLLKVGDEMHGKLYSDYANTNPPMFARNIDAARRGEEPQYQIGKIDDPSTGLTSIGLIKDMDPGRDYDKMAFGSYTDSIVLGMTNHKFDSAVGPLMIQIAHLGGFYGNEGKGRWVMPVIFGYSSEDPSVPHPRKSWVDSTTESEDYIPFREEGQSFPLSSYQSTLNRFFNTMDRSVASFSLGLDLIIDEQNYPEIATQFNFPPELYSDEFQYGNDVANKNAYEWLKWKAIRAAALNKTHDLALWSSAYIGAEPVLTYIEDVFPEVTDPSSQPNITTSEELFASEKETLTVEDLVNIPCAFPQRLKVTEEPLLQTSTK